MKNRLFIFILTVSLLLCAVPAACAVDNLDPDQECSLTFRMDFSGIPLNSGSLTIYQVAEVYADNGWQFRLVSELSGSGIRLNDLGDPWLAYQLADQVVRNNLSGLTQNIRMGAVRFEELDPGLYLVIQTGPQASDGYDPIAPFLISLPQLEGEHYIYDVVSKPKVPIKPEPTTTPTTKPTDPHLPQTGQTNWPIPVMASGGLLLFALGWYLYFGKKEGYET